MSCLVTGCALLDPANNRMVWGDLHAVGRVCVFDAVLENGEAAWQSPIAIMNTTPSCTLNGSVEVFERRGMLLFFMLDSELNDAAKERLP